MNIRHNIQDTDLQIRKYWSSSEIDKPNWPSNWTIMFSPISINKNRNKAHFNFLQLGTQLKSDPKYLAAQANYIDTSSV